MYNNIFNVQRSEVLTAFAVEKNKEEFKNGIHGLILTLNEWLKVSKSLFFFFFFVYITH